jgi:anti-anti-sigma factor
MAKTRHTSRRSSTFRPTIPRHDAPPALTCSFRRLGGSVCLSVAGDIDLVTIGSFRTHLRMAVKHVGHLALDFGALRYIDSSGVHALLDAYQAVTLAKGRMALVAVPPNIRRVLAAFGVDEIIPVFSTLEEATADVRDDGRRAPATALRYTNQGASEAAR